MAQAGAPPDLSQIGVATVPGITVENRMFSSHNSQRSEPVMASSAALVALYML